MLEEFSAGYYLSRLYVAPRDGEQAVMHADYHELANEQVYATGEDGEHPDAPLVMKLDETHFPVHGASDVPAGTLAVPEAVIEATRVEEPPTLTDVLIAKATQASQLLQYFGGDVGGDSSVPIG